MIILELIDNKIWKIHRPKRIESIKTKNVLLQVSEEEFQTKVDELGFYEPPISVDALRQRREIECFPIINRGRLWYESLTEVQLQELSNWYQAWLDVTETKVIPNKPSWLI